MSHKSLWISVGIAVLCFGGGFGVAYAFRSHFVAAPTVSLAREGGYSLINPLLSCDISEDTPYASLKPVQKALQTAANQAMNSGQASRVSIYFRDMDYGAWTGVEPDDLFIPASLWKVPILIAWLKDSETDPSVLNETLPLNGPDQNAAETIRSSNYLPLGASYSVNDLLTAMIEQSDNNANAALVAYVSTSTLDDVYQNFGVPPDVDVTQDSVSPKEYFRLFRILYNGSYLWTSRAETALNLLSHTDFDQGLVAGVPAGTTVTHKFGERTVINENVATGATTTTAVELHDCGIVYYTGQPYGLCVMTQGTSITTLEGVIANISKVAYEQVAAGALTKSREQ